MQNAGPDLATIYDTAADIVVHDGIDAVTYRALSSRTGVDETVLRDRFVSVEHVLVETLNREYARLTASVVDNIERDPRGGLLSRIYLYSLSAVYERPLARALYVIDPAALNRLMRTVAATQYQPATGVRTTFITRMAELGMTKDVDPLTVSAMLSAFSAGLALTSPSEDFDLAVKGMEYVLSRLVDADVEDTQPGKIAFYEYAQSLAGRPTP